MIKLYEIADDYKRALDIGDDVESEQDGEALATLLGEITDRFENKAAAVAAYMRNVEAEAKAYKEEAERLDKRAKTLLRRYDALKDYLAMEMRRCELTECQAGLFALKFVKTPWSVEVDPGVSLPDEYMRHKPAPPPEPDKIKISEALKAGKQIDGARLVQGERLRIT